MGRRRRVDKVGIHSIGLEFECGFPTENMDEIYTCLRHPERLEIGHDPSVTVEPDFEEDFEDDEWSSSAEFRYWSEDLQELHIFITTMFNLGARQNETCGNHLHFKFKPLRQVGRLLSFKPAWEVFRATYEQEVKRRFRQPSLRYRFLGRLEDRWCWAGYSSDPRALLESRYRMINFCAEREHRTLEVRILPYADNAKQLKEGIDIVLTCLERAFSYILEQPPQAEIPLLFSQASLPIWKAGWRIEKVAHSEEGLSLKCTGKVVAKIGKKGVIKRVLHPDGTWQDQG